MQITATGKLIHDSPLPQESRDHWIAPHHPNGLQLSPDRFLLLVGTVGFAGKDDARGIGYELRAESYVGPVLARGALEYAQPADTFLPPGVQGRLQLGHPQGFGVPLGAVIDGRELAHQNLFCARWRACVRLIDPATGRLRGPDACPELAAELDRSFHLRHVHFRLNAAASDIELLHSPRPWSQHSSPDEAGRLTACSAPIHCVNVGFCDIPFANSDAAVWYDILHDHVANGALYVARYEYDPVDHRYRWTATGEAMRHEGGLMEGAIIRNGDGWLVMGRRRHGVGVAWAETHDPLAGGVRFRVPASPAAIGAPATAFRDAAGVVRLFTGNAADSPHTLKADDWLEHRNPLFAWAVDSARDFEASDRQCVFDVLAAGIGLRRADWPICDYGKLLAHAGGDTQHLLFRVRPAATVHASESGQSVSGRPRPTLTPKAFEAAGIYHATLNFDEAVPGVWTFAKEMTRRI